MKKILVLVLVMVIVFGQSTFAMTKKEINLELDCVEDQLLILNEQLSVLKGIVASRQSNGELLVADVDPFAIRKKGFGYFMLSDEERWIYDQLKDQLFSVRPVNVVELSGAGTITFSDIDRILYAMQRDNRHLILDDMKTGYTFYQDAHKVAVKYDVWDFDTYLTKVFTVDAVLDSLLFLYDNNLSKKKSSISVMSI